MRLAICDYAHRSFAEVLDELGSDVEQTLREVAERAGIALNLEAGPLRVVAPRMAAVHTRWSTPDARLWFEGELRVLAVNRGSDAVTELLLVGEAAEGGASAVLPAWGHRLLAILSGVAGAAPVHA